MSRICTSWSTPSWWTSLQQSCHLKGLCDEMGWMPREHPQATKDGFTIECYSEHYVVARQQGTPAREATL